MPFGKLFGKENRQSYVSAGTALTLKLCHSLELPDWKDGLPNYTQEEVTAIDRRLSRFQQMAGQEMGRKGVLRPDIQHKLAGGELYYLADSWRCSDSQELPANWKAVASTYLKGWALDPDPLTLIGLANLLVKAGYKSQARQALEVVLLLPTCAKTYGWDDDKLLGLIISHAQEILKTLQ